MSCTHTTVAPPHRPVKYCRVVHPSAHLHTHPPFPALFESSAKEASPNCRPPLAMVCDGLQRVIHLRLRGAE
jgi:hypothetical protein